MNTLSVRALLVRGMLSGLAAGAAALLVAYFLGESRVDAAIALEEHAAGGHHDHGGEEELVSRAMQATGGLATGVLVFGVAVGGIAAIAFCVALGRIGRFGPRATAAFLLAVTLAYVFLPSYNEVGPDFPGQLLWQFRLATLAVQAVLWAVFGLVFGVLAERLLTPASARPRSAETVAA
ncbi:CbtA family protein [Streptomyces sp. SCA2-2]|uniref:CbtA family protein n=1 Tax=Streptomyces sp. SCA2-2 TaxID=1563677 RepID=UPI00101F9F45|nr:CbtA family protein [Streptomyces sp. SCA2-2]RZF01959.1 hypothetical protein C0L86_07640 [Streptomyces sp. SCA2-2]